jgi:hypothetical protein
MTWQNLSLAERMPPEVLDPVLAHVFEKISTEGDAVDGGEDSASTSDSGTCVRVQAQDMLTELLSVRMGLVAEDGMRLEQAARGDIDFLREHATRIHGHVYEGLSKLRNGPVNYVSLCCAFMLLLMLNTAS